VEIDGVAVFVERRGKVVRQFVFNDVERSFNANPISTLSSNLIVSPVDAAVLNGTESDDANWYYLVCGDGTVACLNTLRSEGVIAWTRWTTDGEFTAVTVLDNAAYFVVQRGGSYYLEKASPDYYLDAAVQGVNDPASATVSGLAHLNGVACGARLDGSAHQPVTPVDGSITFGGAVSVWEIGRPFTVTVETMPAIIQMEQGIGLTRRSRIIECSLDVFETIGLTVNGYRVPDRRTDLDNLDSAPAPFTGVRNVRLNGWTVKPKVRIEQADPFPLTVRALDLLVEANTHGS
jgi:hypothetical protein